jgi:hypothetical protein
MVDRIILGFCKDCVFGRTDHEDFRDIMFCHRYPPQRPMSWPEVNPERDFCGEFVYREEVDWIGTPRDDAH